MLLLNLMLKISLELSQSRAPSRSPSTMPSTGHYILLVRVTALVLGPNGNTAGANAPLKTTFLMPGHLRGTCSGVLPSLRLCHRMHADIPEGPTAAGGCQEDPS